MNRSVENLYISDSEGDFYLILGVSPVDILTSGVLDFYKNRKVPKEAYKYLSGTYEGKFESDDFFENLAFLGSGGINIKVTFMDDSLVEMCLRNLVIGFLSGKKEPCGPCNYYIEGDNITFDGLNGSGTIRNRGENILFKYKNCTVNLQKKQ